MSSDLVAALGKNYISAPPGEWGLRMTFYMPAVDRYIYIHLLKNITPEKWVEFRVFLLFLSMIGFVYKAKLNKVDPLPGFSHADHMTFSVAEMLDVLGHASDPLMDSTVNSAKSKAPNVRYGVDSIDLAYWCRTIYTKLGMGEVKPLKHTVRLPLDLPDDSLEIRPECVEMFCMSEPSVVLELVKIEKNSLNL